MHSMYSLNSMSRTDSVPVDLGSLRRPFRAPLDDEVLPLDAASLHRQLNKSATYKISPIIKIEGDYCPWPPRQL